MLPWWKTATWIWLLSYLIHFNIIKECSQPPPALDCDVSILRVISAWSVWDVGTECSGEQICLWPQEGGKAVLLLSVSAADRAKAQNQFSNCSLHLSRSTGTSDWLTYLSHWNAVNEGMLDKTEHWTSSSTILLTTGHTNVTQPKTLWTPHADSAFNIGLIISSDLSQYLNVDWWDSIRVIPSTVVRVFIVLWAPDKAVIFLFWHWETELHYLKDMYMTDKQQTDIVPMRQCSSTFLISPSSVFPHAALCDHCFEDSVASEFSVRFSKHQHDDNN